MPFIIDAAYDAQLNYIKTNGTRLDLCSAEPTTYTQATSTLTLANKSSPTITGPADASPNGRKISVGTFTDGTGTATGTATHWALTNGSNTLIATNALSASVAIASGNAVSLTSAIDIVVSDAASA